MTAVVWEKQTQTNWCWAACVRMAAAALGRTAPAQCTIAGQFLHAADCCVDGSTPACNQTLDENLIPALYTTYGLTASSIAMTDAALRRALASAPLVQAQLDMGTAFHYVLVTGYDAKTFYAVADPINGAFNAGYADISTAYGNGAMINAWRVVKQ